MTRMRGNGWSVEGGGGKRQENNKTAKEKQSLCPKFLKESQELDNNREMRKSSKV